MIVKTLKGEIKTKYPIIGHGNQGTIFKVNKDTVLKVYNLRGRRHDNFDDLEVAKRLQDLKLQSFITPFDIEESDGVLESYKMKRIEFDKIKPVDLKFKDYIESLRQIREDAQKISDKKIQMRDLQEHNICVSKGRITVYDFSDYFLGKNNVRLINDGIINDCFGSFALNQVCDDSILLYDKIYAPFLMSRIPYIEDYFDKTIEDKNETVRDYVKRLKK